jgi:hypothetical protein
LKLEADKLDQRLNAGLVRYKDNPTIRQMDAANITMNDVCLNSIKAKIALIKCGYSVLGSPQKTLKAEGELLVNRSMPVVAKTTLGRSSNAMDSK